MSGQGVLTRSVGERLREWLSKEEGYEVVYDHGDSAKPYVGEITCWFGGADALSQDTRLSALDIAVVTADSGRRQAVALIEIEESDDRPKNLLGDLFGTLLADHVAFRRDELEVDARTALILMASGPTSHQERMDKIVHDVRECRGPMRGRNSVIDRIAGELFSEEGELEAKLRKHVEEALGRFEQVA